MRSSLVETFYYSVKDHRFFIKESPMSRKLIRFTGYTILDGVEILEYQATEVSPDGGLTLSNERIRFPDSETSTMQKVKRIINLQLPLKKTAVLRRTKYREMLGNWGDAF